MRDPHITNVPKKKAIKTERNMLEIMVLVLLQFIKPITVLPGSSILNR